MKMLGWVAMLAMLVLPWHPGRGLAADKPTTGSFDANGVKISYAVQGKGDAVILIHGWPLSADSWDAQALALADAGFRAIAYDRRGFGRSGQPWGGRTVTIRPAQ